MSLGIYGLSSRVPSLFRAARLRLAILACILGVVSSEAIGQRVLERPSFATPVHPEKYVPGRLLVRFRPGKSAAAKTRAHSMVGAQVLAEFQQVRNLQLVALPSGQDVLLAAQQYRQNPDVLYAEPDYRVFPSEIIPNDPLFPLSWGLQNTGDQNGITGADIHATEAWQLSTGSRQVVVGLLDTGVDYTHPDLAANIYPNSGINVSVNGDPNDPYDYIGHGTHVSGIMGALGNNGLGVSGVNWQLSIIPCKFIDFSGGTTSGAIQCLDYIASFKQQGVNVIATNNSWGGGFYSQALHDAIQAQMDLGILFVVAAGNGDAYGNSSDNDVNSVYPASYDLPNVVAVAATDRRDELAWFSNYGRHSVHLGAPGVSVLSTIPNSSYQELSGTSMATPHVTGGAALLAAYNPSLDWIAIKNLLMAGGDPNPNLSGTVSQKRLNVYGAMTCNDQRVLGREEPRNNLITASINAPILLRILNIDCAAPGGSVTVTAQPGNTSILLLDDGNAPDLVANDGVYSATWTPTAYGVYSLVFPEGDVVTVDVLKPYNFSNGSSTYVSISGNYLGLEDERTATVNPPFPVQFGGQTFSTIYVSDNGIITFDRAYNVSFPMALPWIDADSLVAPFWDDLEPIFPGNNNVFWDVVGTAPNRELVVEWRDVYEYPFYYFDGGTGTFEVVFHENSDEVDFNYANVLFGTPWYADNGAHAGVGIQIGPAEGTQFSLGTASLSNGMSLVWQPSNPDFSLQLVSSNLQAFPNQVVNFSGTATALFDFDSSVTISCTGGVPNTCLGLTVTPSATGTSFQVQAANSSTGTYNFQIHGASVSPAITHDQSVTLSIVDFSLGTPSPNTLNIANGGSGSSTFNLTPLNGFNAPVTLACSGLPVGATCLFSPGSSVAVAVAAVPVTVTVVLANNTILGTYPVSLIASTTGAPAKTIPLQVTAQQDRDFLLTTYTALVSAFVGSSANGAVTIGGQDGYSGTVSLSCSVSPPAPTCNLSKSTINSFPATVTVTLGSVGVTAQSYQVTINGTDGTKTHSVGFTFDVTGFGVSGPSTLVAYMATDNVLPITVTPQSGYKGTVSVSCDVSAFPAGDTCTPESLSLDFSNATSLIDNIHIYAPPGSSAGTYSLTITTRDASGPPDNITLVSVAIEGFTFTLSPPTEQTVLVGNTSAPFDMVFTPLNGYSLSTQLLDWTCNPAGSVCTFDQNPITPNGSPVHVKMSVSVPLNDRQSLGGDFGFTVLAQATDPANQMQISIPINTPVTVHVQDFALVPSYSVIILVPGSSFPVQITNQQFNGLSIPVTLDCPSPLPPGISCTLDKSTLAPGDVATLTFSATLDAPPSLRTFEIVGVGTTNGETIQHTIALSAWISNFALTLDPASISVASGGDAWYTVEVFGADTFGGDPGALITCESPDPGITCDSPYEVPAASGFAAFAVNVRTTGGVTPVGSHPFTVSVTEWGETQSISGTIIMEGDDSLVVYTPNGGELWSNGTQNISWHYKGNPGSTVKIELLNNGQLAQTIASSAPIGSNGEGFYSWQMPSSLQFSQHYTIRVTSTSNSTITDTSDSRVWMGQGVDLNVPATGQIFYVGGVMFLNYTWSVYGHVRFDLYKAGKFVQTVDEETISGYLDSGGWQWGAAWQIPSDFPPGSDYTMMIVPVDAPSRAVTSGAFTISKTSITVTAPAGGEIWQPGTTHTIAWSWVGQPVSPGVDVEITLNNGYYIANNGLIAPTTPIGPSGSGSFNWTIPNNTPPSTAYSITVTSFAPDNNNFGATSNGYFAIGNYHHLTVSLSGNGTVQSSDNSISCGTLCSGQYLDGTAITLTATPAYGWQFTGWSGACTGTGNCLVTLNSDLSVVATFYLPTPDIDIVSSPNSATVNAGQQAQYSLTMTPQGNVTGTATLSCSGLPRASSCTFQPNSFQVTSSAASSTLTISTTARSTADAKSVRSRFVFATWLLTWTLLTGLVFMPRNRRRKILLTMTLSLTFMPALVTCGGSGGSTQPPPQSGTPAGSYSVQVQVQTAAVTKTTAVTLNVN